MDGVSGIGATPPTTASQASVTGLADNFDTFLTLLTTQLQNQDPLSPMDSNEFTKQLVQFSEVEQSIATNTNLEQMLGLLGASNAANTVALIGKEVTFAGGTNSLVGGKAKWNYSLADDAKEVSLTIEDESGKLVYVGTGETEAGSHEFNWDGKDNSGSPLQDGIYTLTVTAKNIDNTSIETEVLSLGQVTGVQSGAEEAELLIGDASIPASLMLRVNEITSEEQTES